jgi:phosphoribosylamine--glycine ligase
VLAGGRYPEASDRGTPIDGLDDAAREGLVFHAGTSRDADGTWHTDGGRILTTVGRGADLDAARAAAERAAAAVSWPGMQRRRDIAATAVGAAR